MSRERDEALGRFVEGAGEERPSEALPEADVDACVRGLRAFEQALEVDEERITELVGLEPPRWVPEDFEVEEEIGRGGMGIVYRARQVSLDRPVALKVLRPGELLFGQAIRRFLKEARHLARLRHRHIVAIHEVGEVEGRVYFTMDLVDGRPLSDLIRDGEVTPARAVRILRQVASAVAYVHSHGIVHRDLKPQNILVDHEGEAYVTDFGLAFDTRADDSLTLTGQVLGTPAYMSPEQARGDAETIGEATDVYALGVILYECLTGKRPFADAAPGEQLHAVLHTDPIPPYRLDRRVHRDLEAICLKAMRKAPSARYATARAFLEDLESFEEGRPVRADRPSVASHLRRWFRKHRASWAGAGLGAVVLALAAWIFVRPWVEDRAVLQTADALADRNAEAAEFVYERVRQRTAASEVTRGWIEARLAHGRELTKRGHYRDAEAHLRETRTQAYLDVPWPDQVHDLRPLVEWELATALHLVGEENKAKDMFSRAQRSSGTDPDFLSPILWTLEGPTQPGHEAATVQLAALLGADFWPRRETIEKLTEDTRVARTVLPGLFAALGTGLVDPDVHEKLISRYARYAGSELDRTLRRVFRDSPNPFVRRMAAHWLGHFNDLPLGMLDEWDHRAVLRKSYDAKAVVDLWRRVSRMSPTNAFRHKMERAISSFQRVTWTRRTNRAPPSELPMTDPAELRGWLARHGAPRKLKPDSAEAWWRTHKEMDPRDLLAGALGLDHRPTIQELFALLEADAPRRTRTWLGVVHNLLILLRPRDVHVQDPTWASPDVVSDWFEREIASPRPRTLQLARAAFRRGRWQLLNGLTVTARISMGQPVAVRCEAGVRPPVSGGMLALRVPGLRWDVSRVVRQTHHWKASVRWGRGRPHLHFDEIFSARSPGGSQHFYSWWGNYAPVGYVTSPDLKVRGHSEPNPYYDELTLAIVLPKEDGMVRPWSLADWQAALARDVRRLADGAERRGNEPGDFLQRERKAITKTAALAAHIPVPEAAPDLRRLDRLLVSRKDLPTPRAHVLMARLQAGDASPLDQDPQVDWDAVPRSGIDGSPDDWGWAWERYWTLLLVQTEQPRIRKLALAVLDVELRPRAAGDLLDAWRAGTFTPDPALRRRLEEGPTDDRSLGRAFHDLLPLSALVPLLYLAALVALGLAWVRRRAVDGAWLLLIGVVATSGSARLTRFDFLPGAGGCLLAALGCLLLGHRNRSRPWAAILFGLAAVADRISAAGVSNLPVAPIALAAILVAVVQFGTGPRRPTKGRRRFAKKDVIAIGILTVVVFLVAGPTSIAKGATRLAATFAGLAVMLALWRWPWRGIPAGFWLLYALPTTLSQSFDAVALLWQSRWVKPPIGDVVFAVLYVHALVGLASVVAAARRRDAAAPLNPAVATATPG